MPERLARLTERLLMPATCWTWAAWVAGCAVALATLRLRDTVAGLRGAGGCSPACPCQVDLDPELEPVCASCTRPDDAAPGEWLCDPERPGCPLHAIPAVTR